MTFRVGILCLWRDHRVWEREREKKGLATVGLTFVFIRRLEGTTAEPESAYRMRLRAMIQAQQAEVEWLQIYAGEGFRWSLGW